MQEQNYSIRQWAKDDRPREKLLIHGPRSLSDAELLAILLHHGTKNRSAVDLAKDILHLGANNLLELGKLSVHDLMKIKGVGEAKAISVTAALELGKRRLAARPLEKMVITGSRDMAGHLQVLLQDYRHEVFAVVYLNRAQKVNGFEIVSEGGMTCTVVDPRVVLRKALDVDAVSLVLCHNHPSGSLKPSQADESITYKLREAAAYFDIKVIDHIIVSDSGYFSFADDGRL